jgi:hypothetical protein
MKRGQVTIFIILAILIVAAIFLVFMFRKDIPISIGQKPSEDPNAFFETCIQEKIKQTADLISIQGGYVKPEFFTEFKFEGEEKGEISYLCYNQNYYYPCISQEPMLIQHLKNELHQEIKYDVKNCFDELTKSLSKKGYAVDANYDFFEITLAPKKIIVDVFAQIKLTKTGESTTQKDFKVIVSTRFYDNAVVAQEIISQEARFCNFEQLGFMLIYPQFNIDKFRTSDLSTIYTIEHRKTNEKFRFVVRGCVIPPGI